ncbi:flagellar biosynthetic protein FliO [Alicyclobacillus sp. SO9]|uniref:flagellar biosynthetic protein FliO n=1 Tax=Alicyclobacillus sp. SO9 TaxID=2665646 RepID=UPI0018E8D03A|nr:flagellar biosynthetic protein FliO [Alicyclobacillus sp. SO9]QQE80817.1 flagellar biosynthetic protein FliO [Alicyclobacillus sp. SO9]
MRFFVSVLIFTITYGQAMTAVYAASNSTKALEATGLKGPSFSTYFKGLLWLIVIIILVIITIKFLARKTQVKQTGSIRVLAAHQLAPSKFVEVVEVQGKRYLVGVGDDVTLLADVTEDFDDAGQGEVEQANFQQVFANALQVVRKKYGRDDRKEDTQ